MYLYVTYLVYLLYFLYIHYSSTFWIYSWSFSVSRPYSDLPCVMFSCWGRSIGSLVFPQGWRKTCWCLPVGDTSLPPSLDVLHWWWLCVCSYGSCLPTSVKRLQVVGWLESLTQENISVAQAGMVGAIYCAAAPQPCVISSAAGM